MAQECAPAASTECTLYNNQDQKYFTNREVSGLCMDPSWQSSLALQQGWACSTEGSTEVQLGSPTPGSTVGPEQHCVLQGGTIPAQLLQQEPGHTYTSPGGGSRAHLGRALGSAWGSFGRSPAAAPWGSPPPASLTRATLTANTSQKVRNAPRTRFPIVLGGVCLCSEALLRSDSAQESRQGFQRGSGAGGRVQKHPLSF